MRKNIFLNRTDKFPTLYMDMVFVESIHPILFTCTDEDGRLYICSCCYSSGYKCIWIVSETTPNKVISLLQNECDIWDMFGDGEYVTVVTQHNGSKYPEIQFLSPKNVPVEFLPTKGYGMDTEDGEFEEELKELQTRLDYSYKYEVSHAHDSFYISTQMIYINIKPGISTKVSGSKYWKKNIRTAVSVGG